MTALPRAIVPRGATFRHPGFAFALVGAGGAVLVGGAASFGLVPGLGALLAAVLGVAAVRRPDLAAYTLVAVTPVVSGLKRGLPVPTLRLSEVIIAGAAGLILVTADRVHAKRWGAFDWMALAYAATTLVAGTYSLVTRDLPFGNESLRALLNPLQYLLLYRAVVIALPGAAQRRIALRLLLIASVPASLLALLQRFHIAGVRGFIPDLTGIDIDNFPGAAADGERATGAFPHWQVLAGYEVLVFVLVVALWLQRRQRVASRPLLAVAGALSIVAILTTVTLTAMGGAIAGALLLGAWARRYRRVAVALALGALIAVAGFGPALERRLHRQFDNPAGDRPSFVPQTVDYRYRVWTGQYFPALEGKWVTGYGPNNPPEVRFPFTESVYVLLLIRGGLPLLTVYLLLVAVLLAAVVRARDDPDPDRRAAARALTVGIVLLIPMHFMEPYFILTGAAHVFWLMAALVLAGEGRVALAPQGRVDPRARRRWAAISALSGQRRLPGPSQV